MVFADKLTLLTSDEKTAFMTVNFQTEANFNNHRNDYFDSILPLLNKHLPEGIYVDDVVEPDQVFGTNYTAKVGVVVPILV